MKTFYALIIIPVFYKTLNCEKCCSSAKISKNICSDGKNLAINCTTGHYIINSEEEKYTLENGSLHITGDKTAYTVPKKRFCVGVDEESNNDVAIICFDFENRANTEKVDYMKMYSICLIISDIFLVITLGVYIAYPSLRDLQGKSVMAFTISLCLGYLLLAIMQQEYFGFPLSTFFCKLMGFILYYFMICAFLWLTIISFNIWRTTTCKVNWTDSQLWTSYVILGYGCASVFLLAVLLAHHTPGNHIKPDFSSSCWFSGKLETWTYFYGPIGILLVCNIVFFAMTVVRLWKDYKDSNPSTRIQVLRFKCLLYLKLFLTMGITWIFEILSYIFELDIWYVTDIMNSLQGVIIFIVMVATRRRVFRLLGSSAIFKKCFKKNWQTIKDEESENIIQAEQIQLS